MRHHGEHRGADVPGREEGNLVDVFQDEIKSLSPKPSSIQLGQSKMRIVPRSSAQDAHALNHFLRLRSWERLREPGHLVAVPDGAGQDLREMELGASGLRVAGVPPVEREEIHPIRTPEREESAGSFRPSAPITK